MTGLTLDQAKAAIERHLSQYLQKPEVAVDVLAYNSKVYYIIFDGAGNGQQMTRLPITGNDTVLDAISQIYGLLPVADKHHIWVARPAPQNRRAIRSYPWTGLGLPPGAGRKRIISYCPVIGFTSRLLRC